MPQQPRAGWIAQALAACLLVAGCEPPSTCEGTIPFLSGGYILSYKPSSTRYLNDHSIIKGRDNRWHVIGITDTSLGNPQNEKAFLHASATSLEGPWTEEPDALTVSGDEASLWAPHIVEMDASTYAMYYFPNNPKGLIYRADSADLMTWTRSTRTAPGGRDPFLLRDGTRWLMYSVGVSPTLHGRIVVASSSDLATWTSPAMVIEDPLPSFSWGNLESPYVVVRDGRYYLFLTRTSEAPADYTRTVVFVSTDPMHFAWEPVAELYSHAGEVVDDGGSYFLTSAGWTANVGERWRGLSIAAMDWAACPQGD